MEPVENSANSRRGKLIRMLMVGVSIAFFFALLYVLWRSLSWFIAPETAAERTALIQAYILSVGGLVAFGTLLVGWRNLRHNHRALAVQQRTTRETLDNQRILEEQRAQDTALQAYLERMGELLLDRDLRNAEDEHISREAVTLAQMHTLTILRRLDADRKGSVLQFLYGVGVIGGYDAQDEPVETIVSLHNADLSNANLSGANLERADLSGTNLSTAELSSAKLMWANLHSANLSGANLSVGEAARTDLRNPGAQLQNANLALANLSGANLHRADLFRADLNNSKLMEANLSDACLDHVPLFGAQLQGANLRGAFLQDANLMGAIVKGADLREAKFISQEQIEKAAGDEHTSLPEHLEPPESWTAPEYNMSGS